MGVISVVGLGKLGACTAACLAARGFDVLGIDINRDFVRAINHGVAPVYEPRLQDLLAAARGRLRATHEYARAIDESDVTFLIVPTPVQPDGAFADAHLREALTQLSSAFERSRKAYHLFVITSTVSPGTTGGRLIPLIESVSGKRLHADFGVCYNPEFIALGSVITDFLNPDLVLIGESDRAAGDRLEAIYRRVCENAPVVARMSVVSAEITKISLNSYVTMKISFANTLASLCEGIPGAEIDLITRALGADRRVSPHTLKGGLPFGGPCFPRDNRAFAAFAGRYGVDAKLARASDEINASRAERLADLVLRELAQVKARTVSVLGLAYKANTPVIEESPTIQIIHLLLEQAVDVMVYDPLALDGTRAVFGDRIRYAPSARACAAHGAVCVVTTPGAEVAEIQPGDFTHDPTVVIDCWRTLDRGRFGAKVKYVALGLAPER